MNLLWEWIPSLPDLLQTSNSSVCYKQHLELISQWTNVVGSVLETTRRNQDLDMKLKVATAETCATSDIPGYRNKSGN